eukprot:CAMPEP_0170740634 /NCGR_PEP_ID=MMETSP0437-20130122/5786_1 /TAXON_ID=0 /ORGANISM="Sexangularia sp." /LENGTH=623 /DNA_ID=CAMNT_0011079143 /DNA_START=65 /DNA_END=1936 /DNA_ORIENTATION=-
MGNDRGKKARKAQQKMASRPGNQDRAAKGAVLAAAAREQAITDELTNSTVTLAGSIAENEHEPITCTGVLATHKESRDIKVESFNMNYYGAELVVDSSIEFSYGHRYGIIGPNGVGKSTFLKALAQREVPIPEFMDIYLLRHEAAPQDKTGMQYIVEEAQAEVERLERTMENLLIDDPDSPLIMVISERLEKMDPETFESRAGELLVGLGFDEAMMAKATKDMSGGWRMRVSLAKALFIEPWVLVLDGPSEHLDMEATVWLEEHLKTYPHILVLTSHSIDFLNNVCTNIVAFQTVYKRPQLVYYTGNYDQYLKTREEFEINQIKHYKKQQEEIKHHKDFIASCGTFSNLVRQAKSRQKLLDKMVADGLFEMPPKEPTWHFSFPETRKLPPPVVSAVDMSFSYPNGHRIYKPVSFGLDSDSRVALVGPNGAGKSTLLKLITGQLQPTGGQLSRNPHLKCTLFHQHMVEVLPHDKTPLQFVQDEFPMGPDGKGHLDFEQWRRVVGRYGCTGKQQLAQIGKLSDGQKARLAFMRMVFEGGSGIVLDEPTNSLSMSTIDALADACNKYQGMIVVVSHDFNFLSKVAKEIWICENETITKWQGTILEYKEKVRKDILRQFKTRAKLQL